MTEVTSVMTYMVVTSEESAGSIKAQLIEADIRHKIQINKPPYAGRYSLGVYSHQARAARRVVSVEKRGIAAEVQTRQIDKVTWWLDGVISNEQAQTNVELLREQGIPVQLVQSPGIGS